jgi:hypothetical protein
MKNGVKALVCALIASVTMTFMASPGRAMLAPAQSAAAPAGESYDRAADMQTVQTALESRIVSGRLKALGMNDKEIESRLSKLSDRQVHQFARDVHALSPGGGVIGVLEVVVLVLLIIILARSL